MYLVIERFAKGSVTTDGSERKVIVLKKELSGMDREWISDGRSFAIRLSDMKVSKWVKGKLYWRDDPWLLYAVYDGGFCIAQSLLDEVRATNRRK